MNYATSVLDLHSMILHAYRLTGCGCCEDRPLFGVICRFEGMML